MSGIKTRKEKEQDQNKKFQEEMKKARELLAKTSYFIFS